MGAGSEGGGADFAGATGLAMTTPAPPTSAPEGPSSGADELAAGTLLSDRYRTDVKLGEGGMGVVYRADDLRLGKQVAVKVLSDAAAREPEHLARFAREARAASQFSDPHIVSVTDFGETPAGRPFFVMELLDGEDLGATLARDGPFPWPRARAVMAQILAALAAAHARGVVHRDLKPENCLRLTDGDGRDLIKLLDFGIAKIDGPDDDAKLTRTGAIIGTPHYMSPEQIRGREVDARADLYAAGVILFELVTGQVPFDATSAMGVISGHLTEAPPTASAVNQDAAISPAVDALLRKALAKDPAERFQSASEFADALDPASSAPAGLRRWIVAAALGGVVLFAALAVLLRSAGETGAPTDEPAASSDPPDERATTATDAPAAEALATQSTDAGGRDGELAEDDELLIIDDDDGDSDSDSEEPAATPSPKTARRPKRKPLRAADDPPSGEELPDALSPADRRAGIDEVAAAIDSCRAKGWLPGQRVTLQIVVAADGSVTQAEAQKPVRGSPLGRCLEAAVRSTTFAPTRSGVTFYHALRG